MSEYIPATMDLADKLRTYQRDRSGYAEYCHQAADELDRRRAKLLIAVSQNEQLRRDLDTMRDALRDLCAAADNMRECNNMLLVALDVCDAPGDMFVPTPDEAREKYSEAWSSLKRATHYGNNALKPTSAKPPQA